MQELLDKPRAYLVKQAYATQLCFHFTGIKDATKNTMLVAFTDKSWQQPEKKHIFSCKLDGGFQLVKEIPAITKTKSKKVIFLDEFPWMDSHKGGFLPAFEYF